MVKDYGLRVEEWCRVDGLGLRVDGGGLRLEGSGMV
jgi:hypothetical protein